MIHLQEAGCAVANLLKGRLQQKSAVRVFQFQDLHAGMSSAPSVVRIGVIMVCSRASSAFISWRFDGKGRYVKVQLYQRKMTSTSHTVHGQRFTESLVPLLDYYI